MASHASTRTELVKAEDRERARRGLLTAEAGVKTATAGLAGAQWRFQPAGGWSIAGIVEHIVAEREIVLGPVRQQLAAAPPPVRSDPKVVDEIVIRLIPDRTMRFPAPDFVRRSGRWTPAEALERLSGNTRQFLDWLAVPDLREHAVPSPSLKAVSQGRHELADGYQWLLAAAGHTERHTRQILKVKAAAGFPAW